MSSTTLIHKLTLIVLIGAVCLTACSPRLTPVARSEVPQTVQPEVYPVGGSPTFTSQPYPITSVSVISTQIPDQQPEAPSPIGSQVPEMTIDPAATLSNQSVITFEDNGRTYTYRITNRFMLFLDTAVYPENELVCKPAGIASYVSNASGLYDEKLKLYSLGFEGVRPGVCIIQSHDFRVIIQIIDR